MWGYSNTAKARGTGTCRLRRNPHYLIRLTPAEGSCFHDITNETKLHPVIVVPFLQKFYFREDFLCPIFCISHSKQLGRRRIPAYRRWNRGNYSFNHRLYRACSISAAKRCAQYEVFHKTAHVLGNGNGACNGFIHD